MMRKKILWIIVVVLLAIGGLLWLQQYYAGLKRYEIDLKHPQNVEKFNKFLFKHDREFVILTIMIDDKMKKEIKEGLKRSPDILFHAQDPENKHKKILYIIHSREDGRKEFIFDAAKGKLEGVFKSFRQVDPKGEIRIHLIAINPAELKQKK